MWEEAYYRVAHDDIERSLKESVHARRIAQYIQEHIGEGQKILEVGCGVGGFDKITPHGAHYTGLDTSEYAIAKARERVHDARISFVVGSADQLPFGNDSLDLVFSKFTLEMVPRPRKALEEMMRVLKPGGVLIVVAPNLEFPLSFPKNALRHKGLLFRIYFFFVRSLDYLLRLLGVYTFRTIRENYADVHGASTLPDDDLRYVVSSYEVIQFLKRNGFSIVSAGRFQQKGKRFSGFVKKLMTYVPGLTYYGAGLFVVAQKH